MEISGISQENSRMMVMIKIMMSLSHTLYILLKRLHIIHSLSIDFIEDLPGLVMIKMLFIAVFYSQVSQNALADNNKP